MKKYAWIVLILMSCTFSYSQEITMFPSFFGTNYYHNSTPVTSKQVGVLMKQIPDADVYWRKSINYNIGAWVAVAGQFGFLFWQINKLKNYERGTNQLIGNLACGTVAIALSYASQSAKRKAILTYNHLIKTKSKTSLFVTPSSEGLGIAVHF